MWSIWLGESKFTPSQHLHLSAQSRIASRRTHVGNRRLIITPAGHGFLGKFFVSGKRVPMSCRHVYVNCGNLSASARLLAMGDPIIMRKP
jgi:hypothetical protein